ncbi:MAG: hypothetical protein ACRDGK_10740 [Actinomycetota bacterium]
MLLVTDHAASVFRAILDRDDVSGTAIRLSPEPTDDGSLRISLSAISQPRDEDVPTRAEGVDVFVAPELAPQVEGSVLDSESVGTEDRFVLRPTTGA